MIKRVQKAKTVEETFTEFQKFNQIKNLSDQTIDYYFHHCKIFFNYLSEKCITDIQSITSDTIDDFILWQKDKYSNDITINTNMRATRAFLYYAMGKQYLPEFRIYLLKQPNKIMKTYSDEDIQKLLVKPDFKNCSFVEYRDWVMINYFIETGNRLHSVVNIKVGDVHLSERRVVIRITKNREEIETPLTKTLLTILPPYIETWGLQEEKYLFPAFNGNQLSENGAKQAIEIYNQKHGVSITSIHAFRHTFARNYIVTGGSAFKLQSLLGHKDLTMTRHYVHLFGEDLASDIDEHSIVERIKPTANRLTKNKRRV